MLAPKLRILRLQIFLKNENVYHFVTYNKTKAQVVERFNRTLKQLMWRMFTTTSSYHYLDKLTIRVSTKVSRWNLPRWTCTMQERSREPCMRISQNPGKYKFKAGDQVKISEHKRIFEKGYLPSWTKEAFTDAKRLPRDPPVYRLKEKKCWYIGRVGLRKRIPDFRITNL